MAADRNDAFKDLDINEIEGLDKSSSSGRPLPKKVELDIDDMEFEMEEEEAPKPPPQPLPEPEEEPLVEKPLPTKAKLSRVKLILLASMVVIPLVVAMTLLMRLKPPPPESLPEAITVDLQPFIINFPSDDQDVIVKLTLSVTFPDARAEEDFKRKTVILRDIIFRIIQGRGYEALSNAKNKSELLNELTARINENLTPGRIIGLKIGEVKPG